MKSRRLSSKKLVIEDQCAVERSDVLDIVEEVRKSNVDTIDEVTKYIENCKKYDLHIDPGVVITLQTKWHILQPTTAFSEGSMLSLMGVLDNNNYIRHLKLNSAAMIQNRLVGNGNTNARCLNQILKSNQTIDTLDLTDTGLDDDGLIEICNVLKDNRHVTSLNLSSNHFTTRGVDALITVLQANQSKMTIDDDGLVVRGNGNSSLQVLDLSRCALGFESINKIQESCACNATTIQMKTIGNFVFEEILNSVSHGVAFILSIIGANVMLLEASKADKTEYHYWSAVIYCFGCSFMFLCSTLFHSFFMMPNSK